MLIVYGIVATMFLASSNFGKRRPKWSSRPEPAPEPLPSDPVDDEWGEFVSSAVDSARQLQAKGHIAEARGGAPADLSDLDVQADSMAPGSRAGRAPMPGKRTRGPAAMMSADVKLLSQRMSRAMGELRDQLAATLEDALTQLAEEQRQFQKWLIDEQNHALGEALAAARAERDGNLGNVPTENDNLLEQLAGILHEEMAKLAEEQKHWQLQLVERQREALGEEIAIVAEEQKQFQKRLVAAARAAESKFAHFGIRLNARLDQIAKPESDFDAVASALAETRRMVDERFEQLGRALEGPGENQQLESMLGAIHKEIGLLRKALKVTPAKAQPAVKKAQAVKKASKPRVRETPSRPARATAASKRTRRPPS